MSGFVKSKDQPFLEPMPPGSCLMVYTKQAIADVGSPILAEVKIDGSNLKVHNGRIKYELKFTPPAFGDYILQATLNMGWCTKGDEWLRPGDYTNENAHIFLIMRGMTSSEKDIILDRHAGKMNR